MQNFIVYNSSMNIFQGRWCQFKQELPALLYLAIVQTWLNFNFPAFNGREGFFSVVILTLLSILCILVYSYAFIFPENYAQIINLGFFDDAPDPLFVKDVFRGLMCILFNSVFFYMWYVNYYRVSDIWYVVSYIHFIVTAALIYRAAKNRIIE
jgi:hypothetical protein